MAKKAKTTDGADQNGTAETQNKTPTREVELEVVKPTKPTKPATLQELESAVETAGKTLQESAWAFAMAIRDIHDSKLYPHAKEKGGFYTYMKERWGIERAQSANYVAWVNHEIQGLKVMMLDQDQSAKVDEIAPPATPKHKTVTESRNARSKKSGGTGIKYYVVVEEDGKCNIKQVSLSTAKKHGYKTFSNMTEAEQYLEKCVKEEEDLKARQEKEKQEKEKQELKAALDEVFPEFVPSKEWQEVPPGTSVPPGGEYKMDMENEKTFARWENPPSGGTRPTGDLNQTDVALSPGEDQPRGEYEPTAQEVTELENRLRQAVVDAVYAFGDDWVKRFVVHTIVNYRQLSTP